MEQERNRYHHGDLRATLLREATTLIRDSGVEALSLRRLSECAGVSRTALYHHFRDKNDLLCAIAQQGFVDLGALLRSDGGLPEGARQAGLRGFVRSYIQFAAAHAEQYDLMFGRTIWKAGVPTEALREVAYATFRSYAERIAEVLASLGETNPEKQLRLAQVSWATLHGLCRFLIDGIYVDQRDLDDISQTAVTLLLDALRRP